MKLYPKEEARHMLCRYHNLDGAESLITVNQFYMAIHCMRLEKP